MSKRGEKMKRILLLAIAVGVLFCLSCKDKVEKVEPPLCLVRGVVIDSLTQMAIDRAWLDTDSLVPYWTYTDTLGCYLVGSVEWPGKQRFLLCGKQGYLTKKKWYIATSPDTAIVNFELAPKGK
jgi:hypothetical protein